MSDNHQRLHRGRWAATRRGVLDRDGWRCQKCGKAGRLEVHHIEALADGGEPYAEDNLIALCRPCHFEAGRAARPVRPEAAAWQDLVAELEAG